MAKEKSPPTVGQPVPGLKKKQAKKEKKKTAKE